MEPVATLPAESLPPRGEVLATELVFEGRRLPVILLRLARGHLRCWVNLCPHMAVPLGPPGASLYDRGRKHLVCSTHGALFRPDDGLCVSGPCGGDHLDALEAVEVFGQVQIFVPPALAAELRLRRDLVSALSRPPPAPDEPAPAGPGGNTPA